MKRCEIGLGPGFESRQVHHKQLLRLGRIGTDLITPYRLRLLLMGLNMVFDRARSSRVDSGVGDDPKSSKTK
jgi:hypothetical protein